jgi:hypothetical protein
MGRLAGMVFWDVVLTQPVQCVAGTLRRSLLTQRDAYSPAMPESE